MLPISSSPTLQFLYSRSPSSNWNWLFRQSVFVPSIVHLRYDYRFVLGLAIFFVRFMLFSSMTLFFLLLSPHKYRVYRHIERIDNDYFYCTYFTCFFLLISSAYFLLNWILLLFFSRFRFESSLLYLHAYIDTHTHSVFIRWRERKSCSGRKITILNVITIELK